MKRPVLVFAGVTGVLLLAALGAGEAYARYRERNRSNVPGTMPQMYYRHVRLRHALVRDYSYFGWVHTDSLGMRRTDDGHRPPNARPVVLILGSSTTFDTDVSGDLKAWPARLEARLREKTGFTGAILNGGVSGYRVLDHLIRLETTFDTFRPDLLVLYEAHNDLFATLTGSRASDPHRPGEVPAVAPWTAWLERHSLLYGKIKGRLRAVRFGRTGGTRAERTAADWDQLVRLGTAQFERSLRSFAAVAQARGIPVVWMTVTHVSGRDSVPTSDGAIRSWAGTLPGVPEAVTLDTYRRFNARIAAVAAEYRIPVIDGTASGVAGLDVYAEGDPVHFNDEGADRFAAFVADRLAPHLTQSNARATTH